MLSEFQITRLHSTRGIWQLSGSINGKKIHYDKVSLLGSDGWMHLSLNDEVMHMLSLIEQEVWQHLNEKSAT